MSTTPGEAEALAKEVGGQSLGSNVDGSAPRES
jgi:hypothetical protein